MGSGGVFESESLRVPHPRLNERAFALLPLLDVAPEATDPQSGEPYRLALERCTHKGVSELAAPGRALETEDENCGGSSPREFGPFRSPCSATRHLTCEVVLRARRPPDRAGPADRGVPQATTMPTLDLYSPLT